MIRSQLFFVLVYIFVVYHTSGTRVKLKVAAAGEADRTCLSNDNGGNKNEVFKKTWYYQQKKPAADTVNQRIHPDQDFRISESYSSSDVQDGSLKDIFQDEDLNYFNEDYKSELQFQVEKFIDQPKNVVDLPSFPRSSFVLDKIISPESDSLNLQDNNNGLGSSNSISDPELPNIDELLQYSIETNNPFNKKNSFFNELLKNGFPNSAVSKISSATNDGFEGSLLGAEAQSHKNMHDFQNRQVDQTFNPSKLTAHVQKPPKKPNHNSPENLELLVPLVTGSKIMVNRLEVEKYAIDYYNQPKTLMTKMLELLIKPKEFTNVKITYEGEPIHISETILKELEEFINVIAEPKISQYEFQETLSVILASLKNKYETPNMHQLHSDPMDKLMHDSGVIIDKDHVRELVRHHRSPEDLLRLLLKHVIPPEKLATLQATAQSGYERIPPNILKAVKDFVDLNTDSTMDQAHFMFIIANYLSSLRKKYGVDKAVKNSKATEDLSMIETHIKKFMEQLKSENKIDVHTIKKLVIKYRKNPRALMRSVLSEIMHPEELATLQFSDYMNFKGIPIDIRRSLKDLLDNVAQPFMTHSNFRNNVNSYLASLRVIHGVEKVTIKY